MGHQSDLDMVATMTTPPMHPGLCNCGANKLISVACHERCASRTPRSWHLPHTQATADEVLTYARDTLGIHVYPWQEQMIRTMCTPGAISYGARRNGRATINAFDEAHIKDHSG